MSLRRTVADFFSLEQGTTGTRVALTTGALALGVLAASNISQGWWNCVHEDYCDGYCDHSDTPHSNTYADAHVDFEDCEP